MEKYSTNNITDLKKILQEYGVGILTNYFDDFYADSMFMTTKQWLIDLDIGLTNDTSTWIYQNMPHGTRFGMYQSIISHAPSFWNLREAMYPIFQDLLNEENLLTSIDGASLYPSINAPKNKKKWAHIDQVDSSDFVSYQSQFVASDTSAAFLCTPKSHIMHEEIIKNFSITSRQNTNWHKFSKEQVNTLKEIFGNDYQIPIYVKKGSIIFWDSRTIHSAKYPNRKEDSWRAVFYISMRPYNTYDDASKKIIKHAAINGKTTNHLGSLIFNSEDRYKIKNNKVTELDNCTERVSYFKNFNVIQQKMTGFNESTNSLSQNHNSLLKEPTDFLWKSGLGVYPVELDISQPLQELNAPSKSEPANN